MTLLIYYELVKTFAKWRTYIGFIAVAVVIPLVMWALKIEGGRMAEHNMRSLQNEFILTGNLFNGWFVSNLIMNSLWIHVPFLISLVAGDQLAGEATSGTFRLILMRPVSRTRILLAKYFAAIIYTAGLVCTIAVLSLVLGLLIFGTGDFLIIEHSGIVILPESEAFVRFLLAYGLAIWSMWVVATIAFLFSSFVENAIGPIIATMTVIGIFLILAVLPVESFDPVKPYLFTTYQNVWQLSFNDVLDWPAIGKSVAVLGTYSITLFLLTWIIFKRKDIVS